MKFLITVFYNDKPAKTHRVENPTSMNSVSAISSLIYSAWVWENEKDVIAVHITKME